MTQVDDRMKKINDANKKLGELIEEREVLYGKAPKTEKNKKVQEREMFKDANQRFKTKERIKTIIDSSSYKALPTFRKKEILDKTLKKAQKTARNFLFKTTPRLQKEFIKLERKKFEDI
jgi:hypothetical protein